MNTLINLIEKYPNDEDLGKAIRNHFQGKIDPVDLLKEVLALHGFGGYGHEHGLVERGVLYLETEDGTIKRYKHSCDAELMNRVDDKIIAYLEDLK